VSVIDRYDRVIDGLAIVSAAIGAAVYVIGFLLSLFSARVEVRSSAGTRWAACP
jgi:hypothetical protein